MFSTVDFLALQV